MSLIKQSLFLLATTAAVSNAGPIRPAERRACGNVVDGVGTFNNYKTITFEGSSLPDGLWPSNYQVADRNVEKGIPYSHSFDNTNVEVSGGYLNIKVPGGQSPTAANNYMISSGEVESTVHDILYASVRTKAILSSSVGTCQGMFFYKDDNQETDIEYLSDPAATPNNGSPELHYTNQAVDGGDSTSVPGNTPSGITQGLHEYRIDWTADYTAFYLDGVLQNKLTTNVPTQPGTWLWNNWANGDIQWSSGPPQADSIMKIGSIEMYYNTTSDGAGSC